MVTNVAFLAKSNDPFKKWTKKMSKIENSKILLAQKTNKINKLYYLMKNELKEILRINLFKL